ncbi:TPA: hypothetical protein SMR48_004843 [Pseudomonas putida]|nr:hypothetical protein [Pseudomonas putida]
MSRSANSSLFFYQNGKLVTVKQGNQHRAILRNTDMPLAEVQTGETAGTGLLATDDKGSVLQVNGDEEEEPHAYSSYGHDPTLPSFLTLLGFNGERYDQVIKSALLGNGYRSYNSTLMRFSSPDSWSPFSTAGLNAYCYCLGDPVNQVDPSGHISLPVLAKAIYKFLGLRQRQLPFTGTNGKVVIATSSPRSPRQRVSITPTPRPVTSSSTEVQTAQPARPASASIDIPIATTSAGARSPWPTGATNGRLIEALPAVQPARSRPVERVQPNHHPRHNPAPRARRYSSDTSLSAGSSRDSTPASSRSSSPSPSHTLPDFVQRASDLRSSVYYSRRFDN